MASIEDQGNLENGTDPTTQLAALPRSPPSETVALSPPLEEFTLSTPREHISPEPMSTLNQATDLVYLVDSRTPVRHHSPGSSLPAWKFISPRQSNPAARPSSAMAHRAHTPLLQATHERAATPLPDSSDVLVEHEQHGDTTYTSAPTEQIVLDPDDPGNADVLAFTDTLPMAGLYLFNAKHRKAVREQVAMIKAHHPDDVSQARTAWQIEREGRTNRVPGK